MAKKKKIGRGSRGGSRNVFEPKKAGSSAAKKQFKDIKRNEKRLSDQRAVTRKARAGKSFTIGEKAGKSLGVKSGRVDKKTFKDASQRLKLEKKGGHLVKQDKKKVIDKPLENKTNTPKTNKDLQNNLNNLGSNTLDKISAPLSQPIETFTKGIKAGAEEVKKSREQIKQGDKEEAIKRTAITIGTAGAAAGIILGVDYFAGRLIGNSVKVSSNKILQIRKVRGGKVISKFETNNIKKIGLTSKIFIKNGMKTKIAKLGLITLGSYPFTGFIKEEALQTLQFPVAKAIDVGRFDIAESLMKDQEELINKTGNIIDFIPIANTINSLKDFGISVLKNIEANRIIINEKIKITKGERKSQFDREKIGSRKANQ